VVRCEPVPQGGHARPTGRLLVIALEATAETRRDRGIASFRFKARKIIRGEGKQNECGLLPIGVGRFAC
jgi:hypothetical protein